MKSYLLYPGCSLETNARAYLDSLHAIQEALALRLVEIDDWNCCGATEYLGIQLTPAYAMIGRNLAIASRQSASNGGTRTVVAPCSSCYLNLAKCDHYMGERPLLRERVNEALGAGGLHYEPGSLEVRHLLDIIVHEVGLDHVRSKVTRPLAGLRVAPYMGCMLPRPDYDHRWSDHEYPDELDRLLEVLGAEVIDFPLKAHCCGGHMPHIGPETAFELLRRLLEGAAHYEAHVIATVCPMCQLNLDAYQGETNRHFGTDYRMPVVFFTQLMGLAFGLAPETLGIGSELVDARPMLDRIGVAAPAAPPPPKQRAVPRRRSDKALPMPGRVDAEEVIT